MTSLIPYVAACDMELAAPRLRICEGCKYLDGYQCGVDKARILKTARISTSKCPKGFWEGSPSQTPISVAWLAADVAKGGIGTYMKNIIPQLSRPDRRVSVECLIFYSVTNQTDYETIRWLSKFTKVICSGPNKPKTNDCEWQPGTEVYDHWIPRCDVVTTASNNPHVLERKNWYGKPVLVQLHGVCGFTQDIINTMRPSAARWITTGPGMSEWAMNTCGLPPEKIDEIRLVVDHQRIECPDWESPRTLRQRALQNGTGSEGLDKQAALDCHWLMFLGRFAPEKQIWKVAKAGTILNAMGVPNLTVFAGDGWNFDDERNQIKANNPDNHWFLPWTQDIGDHYASADLMLITSTAEGGPTTFIESLAAGCPVASVDTGLMPWITLNHVPNGPPRACYLSLGSNPSPEEIACTLKPYLESFKPMYRSMSSCYIAHKIGNQYSPRRMAEDWLRVLQPFRE